MSEVQRAGASVLAAALAASLIAGCSGPAPSAESAQAEPPTPAPETLNCMPGALSSLQLPLREGYALAHSGPPTSPPAARCVLALFGTRVLKTPVAFDRAYGRVFAYHEEDGTLSLRGLQPSQLQLLRIGSTAEADVWLLRVDAGTELQPAHRDVLLSTARGDGALVDHLLVGSMGMLYRRDYDIEAVDAFAVQEDTGRGPEIGPGYRANYRIEADGRFVLASSQVLPRDAAAP
jgi:hypothetical protein